MSANETNPPLVDQNCRRIYIVFSRAQGCGISHSWSGTVAFSFDELMHIGQQDGVHYALGYCGSGVGMASYLGMRLGQQVAGLAEVKQRSIICRFLHGHFIVATVVFTSYGWLV